MATLPGSGSAQDGGLDQKEVSMQKLALYEPDKFGF